MGVHGILETTVDDLRMKWRNWLTEDIRLRIGEEVVSKCQCAVAVKAKGKQNDIDDYIVLGSDARIAYQGIYRYLRAVEMFEPNTCDEPYLLVLMANGNASSTMSLQSISFHDTLVRHFSTSSIEQALAEHLPFRIPYTSSRRKGMKLDDSLFQMADCEYGSTLDTVMGEARTLAADISSEMGPMSLFTLIAMILKRVLPGIEIFSDQTHGSSTLNKYRPDFVLTYNDAMVLRVEAKASASETSTARKELVSKLRQDAWKCFPVNRFETIGLTYCGPVIGLYTINVQQMGNDIGIPTFSYTTSPLKLYEIGAADPKFFVDLFKLLRWIGSVEGAAEQSHIPLFGEFQTPSNHCARLLQDGLHKWHHKDREVLYDVIERIYDAQLRHVERGKVIRSASGNNHLLITSIGQPLQTNPSSEANVRDRVISDIREGLNELHNLGIAHCDVRLTNVFWVVDSYSPSGRAVLGDLEFARPRQDSHPLHLRVFPNDAEILSNLNEDLMYLDWYQLEVLEKNFPW